MLQMIFERRSDGTPAARMPTAGDGTPRTPDGVRFFTIEQAAPAFGMSEAELRALYDDTFGDLFPPTAGEDALTPRAIDAGRVQAVRRDLLGAARFGHLNELELDCLIEMCQLRRLDPWRHVWAEVATDPQTGRRELRVITTIAAFILIADRTGKYGGLTLPQYLDADGKWHADVWPAHLGYPVAAKVGAIRRDFAQPQYAVVTWDRYCAYVQTPRGPEVSEFWVKGGPEQLAKCGAAAAIRMAFPEELGTLYTKEEMAQANNPRPQAQPAIGGGGGRAGERSAPVENVEEVEIDASTPETLAEFHAALEGFGFGSEQSRAAVIAKLQRSGIGFPATSRTFWAAAMQRLARRPDLFGALPAAAVG